MYDLYPFQCGHHMFKSPYVSNLNIAQVQVQSRCVRHDSPFAFNSLNRVIHGTMNRKGMLTPFQSSERERAITMEKL